MKSPDDVKKGLECRIRSIRNACNHQCDTCDLRIPAYTILERFEDARTLIQRLEAERNAAVAELAKCTASHCPFCKNYKNPEMADVCYTCRYGIHKSFEWHGVQKEG